MEERMTMEELLQLPRGTPVWTVSQHRDPRTGEVGHAAEPWRLTHARFRDTQLIWLQHPDLPGRHGGTYATPRTIATSLEQAERVALRLNLERPWC